MLPIVRLARHDRPLPYPPKGHVFSLACMVCQAQAILGPIREADRMQQAQYHEQQAAEQARYHNAMMAENAHMQAAYQASGAFNPALSGYPGAGYAGYPGYSAAQFGQFANPFGMSFGRKQIS